MKDTKFRKATLNKFNSSFNNSIVIEYTRGTVLDSNKQIIRTKRKCERCHNFTANTLRFLQLTYR